MKLTPELVAQIADGVSRGASRNTAAQAAGINGRTLRSWCAKGRDEPGSIYFELEAALRKAEAQAQLLAISRAFPLDREMEPRDALNWLGRRWPAEYSEKIHMHVTTQVDTIYQAIEAEFAGEPQILGRLYEAITSGRSRGMDTNDEDGRDPRSLAVAGVAGVLAADVAD